MRARSSSPPPRDLTAGWSYTALSRARGQTRLLIHDDTTRQRSELRRIEDLDARAATLATQRERLAARLGALPEPRRRLGREHDPHAVERANLTSAVQAGGGDASSFPLMPGVLSLCGVRLHYVRGGRHVVRVLDGVSLDVAPGEVVCVWGQRGQGKTTLAEVAAGLVRPAAGRVLFEGEDVWGMAEGRRAGLFGGAIGWVELAAPEVVGAPVLEVVGMPVLRRGGRGEALARARCALELVGVSGCAGERWGSLDEAERARVALARGIVCEPRLLVVDDLTGTLGGREADEVGELLVGWAHECGVGVLACVSSLSEAGWADRVATLFGGELLVAPRVSGGGVVELDGRRPFAAG